MNSIEILPNVIRKNKTLSAKKTYVVQGEVRVLKNVKLTVQGQATTTGNDIDGFSVLGVGSTEWSIEAIKSYFSADMTYTFARVITGIK